MSARTLTEGWYWVLRYVNTTEWLPALYNGEGQWMFTYTDWFVSTPPHYIGRKLNPPKEPSQ